MTTHPFEDLRIDGVLWAINRVVFHPRGFALAFAYPEGADKAAIERHEIEPVGWQIVGDGSEPWVFVSTQLEEVATLKPGVRPVNEDDAFRAFESLLEAHRGQPDAERDEVDA